MTTCISATIFDQIEGKLSLRFHDIGEQSLKNIARPVRAFVLSESARPTSLKRSSPRRRWGRGALAGLVGGGFFVAIVAGAYLAGFIPDLGARARKEAAAWDGVRASRDVAALEGYLASHPEGAAPEGGRSRGRAHQGRDRDGASQGRD